MPFKIAMHRSLLFVFLTACIVLIASPVAVAQSPQKQQIAVKETTGIASGIYVGEIGTEKSPLIVKFPSQEKSAEDAEKEAYERVEKRALDRDVTYYTGATAYITFGMFIVAALQAALFLWQLSMMKKTLKDSKNSSDAVVIGANAARESADIAMRSMVASERAYVHHAGIAFISHPITNTEDVFWRFRPHWTNSGNTPTRGLRTDVKFALTDMPMPSDYAFENDCSSSKPPVTLAPGGTIGSGMADFLGNDLNAVKAGEKYLYVWGVVSYSSVFEEAGEHVTKFCVQAINITGDPTKVWNINQPLGIDFISYGDHNCSDEDCLL